LPADPRFRNMAERVRHNRDLVALLQEKLRGERSEHWLAALEAAGIPAGPVLSFDQVFTDPHVLARGMVAETEHQETGRFRTLGVPVKLSETPGSVRGPAPRLGEHTTDPTVLQRGGDPDPATDQSETA
jgi:crotonobetainyl-CoA:carnitine CoA-transferase CaiB-like acyl-CoA transferase